MTHQGLVDCLTRVSFLDKAQHTSNSFLCGSPETLPCSARTHYRS